MGPSATGTIGNTAAVTGPNLDPETADNEDIASTTVTPLASDLALTKSAPGSVVKTGDRITYTLVASNHGPDPSLQTVLADTLPAQLTYVSDDAGCDTSALPQIECDLGTVAEGESRTVHIVAAVAASDGQPIRNDAPARPGAATQRPLALGGRVPLLRVGAGAFAPFSWQGG